MCKVISVQSKQGVKCARYTRCAKCILAGQAQICVHTCAGEVFVEVYTLSTTVLITYCKCQDDVV